MAEGDDSPGSPRHDRSQADEERRAQRRVVVSLPVEIDVAARGLPTRGTTVNLSRGGALVAAREPFEVGDRCVVRFPMAGPGLVSAVTATVVRVERLVDGNLVGLEFDDELPASPGLR